MIAEKLRQAILQAAIQGKLTKQLKSDDDAKDLLAKIQAEKEKLIKEGKIKKEKPLPEITEDEKPFEIPSNWVWVRHNSLFEIVGGSQPAKSYFKDKPEKGYVRLYQIRDYGETPVPVYVPMDMVSKFTKEGEILLARYGGSLGKVFRAKEGAYNVAMAKSAPLFITPFIDRNFMYYYYLAPLYQHLIKSSSRSAQAGFNKENLNDLFIPIPPLAEQKRIVARIESLLPELDKLEKEETRLEMVQQAFPKAMKDSLLQAAIQGKLTKQLKSDGDAKNLLAKVQAEKAMLIMEGKIKKEKPLPDITDDEKPFEIPENWKWVRLNNICEYIQRGKSPVYSTIKKYPVVAQKCNQWSGFSLELAQFADPNTIKSYSPERMLQQDDLLWNSTGLGTVGRMAIYDSKKNPYELAVADSHVTVIRLFKQHVLAQYVYAYISGPSVQSIIELQTTGSTKQKELQTETVKKYLIPLPPLAEQKRIVGHLNELLPLCDKL